MNLTPRSRRAVVTVVVGDVGKELFAASGAHMRSYADFVGADLVVLDWPGHPDWPMSAKFAIPRVLDFYDRIIYADADVLFRPGCVDLFAACVPDELGAVDELAHHRLQPQFGREAHYQRFRRLMGFANIPRLPWMLNCGVMVIPRSHQALLLPPTAPIPIHHCAEQDHTNSRLLDSGMKYRLLDRRCNWENWTDYGFRSAPADAVLHWSGAGHDRAGRVAGIREMARKHPWGASGRRHPVTADLRGRPRFETDGYYAYNLTDGLLDLLEDVGKVERAVEVGSYRGVSTECIARFAEQVCVVDSWEYIPSGKDEFDKVAKRCPNITRVIEERSPGAAAHFPDASLDLVYIDAGHNYPEIKRDIAAWLPKVAPGGIISGHDYGAITPGVIQAVNEAFGKPDRVYSDSSWLVRQRS